MPRPQPKLAAAALALTLALSPVGASAAQPLLKPELAGISFLIGNWSSGRGQVAETGGTSTGTSRITVAANGGALLRQDHTNLFDKSGKPADAFDQIMLIYPEAGTIRADYSDGAHLIHYTSAQVVPGKSVSFASAAPPGAPAFHLTYTLRTPATLEVAFGMLPPGSTTLRPIATGTLNRAP